VRRPRNGFRVAGALHQQSSVGESTWGDRVELPRRQFLHRAAATAALAMVSGAVRAQAFPARPVRWIVGFARGGGNDIVARLLGQWLSERLGQPFVVENVPGLAGNIATEMVVRAAPDGYTLLLVSSNNATNAALYHDLKFDLLRDIAPVAAISRNSLVLAVNASLPVKTVSEFIAYAKANPGTVHMGSAGTGGVGHLTGEMFKMMTGTELVHVPFRGNGPALTALIDGQVEALFPSLASSLGFITSGKLRALAVTSATRAEALPDLPTVAEVVAGFEASTWYGVGAPRGTPPDVVARLSTAVRAALADPKIKARFAQLGDVPTPMAPAEFGQYIAAETAKWGKVVTFANVKAD
jgi:tripartite-type tricarboxylate transporter receptor subunit TctC